MIGAKDLLYAPVPAYLVRTNLNQSGALRRISPTPTIVIRACGKDDVVQVEFVNCSLRRCGGVVGHIGKNPLAVYQNAEGKDRTLYTTCRRLVPFIGLRMAYSLEELILALPNFVEEIYSDQLANDLGLDPVLPTIRMFRLDRVK